MRSVRRGEKRRFTVVFSSFPLFFSSLFVFLSPSVSAHDLQCRASGSLALARSLRLFWGWCCLLAVVSSLPLCWLWLFWRSASGFDLWAALPLVLSPRLRPCPLLGLALRPLRCCLGVSRRSRVQCYGSSGAGAGRRCRPKGYSRMHNSVMLYLYDMPLAYCTKR